MYNDVVIILSSHEESDRYNEWEPVVREKNKYKSVHRTLFQHCLPDQVAITSASLPRLPSIMLRLHLLYCLQAPCVLIACMVWHRYKKKARAALLPPRARARNLCSLRNTSALLTLLSCLVICHAGGILRRARTSTLSGASLNISFRTMDFASGRPCLRPPP
jgi:hypothetical protein